MSEAPPEPVILSELLSQIKATIVDYKGMRRLILSAGRLNRGKAAQQTANARADNAAERYRRQLEHLKTLCQRAAEQGIRFHDDSLEPPSK